MTTRIFCVQAASAFFLIGGLAPIASFAADTVSSQDDGLDTVVVTGVVGSINRSIGIKRNETAIVDAVSAEDVGKFPSRFSIFSRHSGPGSASSSM